MITKQELQQIIEDLNQLADDGSNFVGAGDILGAICNDGIKTDMLDVLVRNNVPYTLGRISAEITNLAHKIYMLGDYVDSEEKYLDKTLRALDGFKPELQRIQEYTSLLRQIDTLERNMIKYRENILEGVNAYDYKCSLDNVQ